MSDETNNGGTMAVPHAIQIRTDVKKAVSEACKTGVVRSRIVEQLAEEEIEKRKTALAGALTKRDETQREIEKIEKNPANKTFTVVPGETGKIDKAIEMALNPEAPDFSKLKDLG